MSDEIGIIDTYRGCPIHDCQPLDRVEVVVKPEIDQVISLSDSVDLMRWCVDIRKSPESRLLAGAKLEAGHQIAAVERRVRPGVDLEAMHAATAGLGSRKWRDPAVYGSLLDHSPTSGQAGPEVRHPEYRRQVEVDQRLLTAEQRSPQASSAK